MTGRKNEGFTLVELLVSILAASIVTLAATTILLLGMRINAQSTGVVTRQNTARVFMTALENLAAEGVIADARATANNGWEVTDEADTPILTYIIEEGGTGTVCAGGTVLVEDVIYSAVSMDESGLLSCTLETEDGEYELSVYCRTVDTAKTEARNAKKNAFLQTLVSQFQTNDGKFNPGLVIEDGALTETTYLEAYNPAWTGLENKGWCACFVSWALAEAGPEDISRFAYVDDTVVDQETQRGFLSYFSGGGAVDENRVNEEGHQWKPVSKGYIPEPGDLVFMDTKNGGYADHIGVVISVAGGYVYTIEGNVKVDVKVGEETTTIGMVKLQKYSLNYSENDIKILGYGVLNWD